MNSEHCYFTRETFCSVDRLDRALILLGLALYVLSASVSLVFLMLYIF